MLLVLKEPLMVEATEVSIDFLVDGDVKVPCDCMVVNLSTGEHERLEVTSYEEGLFTLTRTDPQSWSVGDVITEYNPMVELEGRQQIYFVVGPLRGRVFKHARI